MSADSIGERDVKDTQPETAQQTDTSLPNAQQTATSVSIWRYFRWRPLPWWFCICGATFLLLKLQVVYNDSPCAVLGTQSPVTKSEVKKAFRSLSMCMHPDRLRGRLGRSATAAEQRRGQIIFNRANNAKEALLSTLKFNKSAKCYEGELEMAVLQLFAQAGATLARFGVYDYLGIAWDLLKSIVTFEAGLINTLLSLAWFAFVFRMIKQFWLYMWRLGALRGSIALVTTAIIGPIPTVLHFIALPVIRLFVFLQQLFKDGKQELDPLVGERPDAVQQEESVKHDSGSDIPTNTGSTASMPVASEAPNRNELRRRKKKETETEREAKKTALLTGETQAVPTPVEAADPERTANPSMMPESIWKCVAMTHKEPIKARQLAASAVQFDLLLILTKPVIPLIMLLSFGQVWGGLWSSLIIGHALRQWVPKMSYEAHHLLCALFGMLHTVLGVSAQQVEDFSNRDGEKILQLAWSWSFQDILAILHMCQLGAQVTAMAALGNEPSYAASFASGIALRMAIAQDSIQGLGFMDNLKIWVETQLKTAGISMQSTEETVAYSGNGIGDCGGGPFRMLIGGEQAAHAASVVVKAWLLLIPLLAALQWGLRTYHASRLLGKRWKTTRFIQRFVLFVLAVVQCFLIWRVELNASNGALGNFWVAMLFGCAGESLLSTYDIRGTVRQILFLLLFLLI